MQDNNSNKKRCFWQRKGDNKEYRFVSQDDAKNEVVLADIATGTTLKMAVATFENNFLLFRR